MPTMGNANKSWVRLGCAQVKKRTDMVSEALELLRFHIVLSDVNTFKFNISK